MMPDEVDALYASDLIGHARAPLHRALLPGMTVRAHGHNPLCGDTCVVGLSLDDARVIEAVGFDGEACAICIAAADLMADAVRGLPAAAAMHLEAAFTRMLRTRDPGDLPPALHPFAALADNPSRIRCAALPWAALAGALRGESEATSE